MDFEDQLKLVEEEDEKAYGDNSAMDIESSEIPVRKKSFASENFGEKARENPRQIIKISEPIDTMASALMAYAKSGNKIRDYDWDSSIVRVGKKMDKYRFLLGFAPSGFLVHPSGFDLADVTVGFVCARKSFGL